MKTVYESLLNQKADASFLNLESLAIINLQLSLTSTVFGKISVTMSLFSNWNLKLNNEQYPMDSIKVEIGYSDSNGIVNFKNSATIIGGANAGAMMPLIWNQSNSQQIFQTEFSKNPSDNIVFNYKILFKISPALPPNFNNEFSGTQNLAIDKNEKDYAIKFILQ